MIVDIEKALACSVLYAEETSARAVRNFTSGVGRQYIGEIGRTSHAFEVSSNDVSFKTDNGNVVTQVASYKVDEKIKQVSMGNQTVFKLFNRYRKY